MCVLAKQPASLLTAKAAMMRLSAPSRLPSCRLFSSGIGNSAGASIVRELAVFWDVDRVAVPSEWSAGLAGNAIRSALRCHGNLHERRCYHAGGRPPADRAGLSLAGFTLVDCPEGPARRIAVDALDFAWRSSVLQRTAAVCLISGDGGHAYLLHRIRDLGLHTLVVYPSKGLQTVHLDALFDAADTALSWEGGVLTAEDGASDVEDVPARPVAQLQSPPQQPQLLRQEPTQPQQVLDLSSGPYLMNDPDSMAAAFAGAHPRAGQSAAGGRLDAEIAEILAGDFELGLAVEKP
eukprot:gnl/TRDRNA2_/TRDRNA2_203945_c0_seq1.p1 gnl/TRDRNA2_/TRDRNA2_203945_c0~~gnl/TRDRNA2_/TRDRNA2_203945_c0_seq1.p1  ORF type:complete len:293 (+),score=52.49 gnl/TRDRNA2_/TRDRNA2_203945_c0_seq1:15-893(+)